MHWSQTIVRLRYLYVYLGDSKSMPTFFFGMLDCLSFDFQAMRDNKMWGGGAEVVSLTNVLQKPIHVYELISTGRR